MPTTFLLELYRMFWAVAWVGRSHLHPSLEIVNHRIGQFASGVIRGHLEVFISVSDRLDQETPVGISRRDDSTIRPAFEKCLPGVEQ